MWVAPARPWLCAMQLPSALLLKQCTGRRPACLLCPAPRRCRRPPGLCGPLSGHHPAVCGAGGPAGAAQPAEPGGRAGAGGAHAPHWLLRPASAGRDGCRPGEPLLLTGRRGGGAWGSCPGRLGPAAPPACLCKRHAKHPPPLLATSKPRVCACFLPAPQIFNLLGAHEFLPSSRAAADLFGAVCRATPLACASIITAVAGFNAGAGRAGWGGGRLGVRWVPPAGVF